MAYRRKGSGKPPSSQEQGSEEPSRSEEPLSTRGTHQEQSSTRCSVCGHDAELFELPGRTGKYCLECSADVATSILLTNEIDAATLAGRDAHPLIAEFAQLSARFLARAQLR